MYQPILDNFNNGLQYAFAILKNTSIPKTNNTPAVSHHISVPLCIMAAIRMLTAVNFNDQPGLPTCEIREIWTDRQLPDELEPVETACAKLKPKSLLRIVFDLAQNRGHVPFCVYPDRSSPTSV